MNSVQENVAKSRKIGKFVQEIHSFRLVSMGEDKFCAIPESVSHISELV